MSVINIGSCSIVSRVSNMILDLSFIIGIGIFFIFAKFGFSFPGEGAACNKVVLRTWEDLEPSRACSLVE